MTDKHVMILGIGNILFCDEGTGVRVVEQMEERYRFPNNVSLVDGGVLGLNLLGTMVEADHLIVVDAIRNRGKPGDLYRIEGDAIPDRIRAKNSLHQIDFLESLTMCQALDHVPQTVIVGVEPEDIETCSLEMTKTTQARVDDIIAMVLAELDRLNVPYEPKPEGTGSDVPRHPF
jgi:hydrogenase maturation protease